MAQDLDAGFHVEQTIVGGRQFIAAREEIAREGLCVASEERPPRVKRLTEEVASLHRFRGAKRKRRLVGSDWRLRLAARVGVAMLHL